MRILIAGGGSGGHVFPGLAVASAIRELAPDVTVEWLGARGAIEERLVPGHGICLHTVRAGKLNRFVGRETLPDLARVPLGIVEAGALVRRISPDAILTCGGYVAVPGGLAGYIARRPVVALQQDVLPNLANRVITPLAVRVVVAFAASLPFFPAGKAVALGNPLRQTIMHGEAAEARRLFDVPDGLPVVLVTGGSQGALTLNRLVLRRLSSWLEHATVIHLCGERSVSLVEAAAAALPEERRRRYIWRAFVTDEMSHLLAAADVVIARAGAATLAELAALAKPAVLVPLPPQLGRSPQEANAATFARAGAAVVLKEKDATPDLLWNAVAGLLNDGPRRQRMSSAAAQLGRPRAARDVAQILLEVPPRRQGA